MQLITCQNGRIFKTASLEEGAVEGRSFQLGLPMLDQLLPRGMARGAVHEVLAHPKDGLPRLFSLILARAAGGTIVWCDPQRILYPPAVAAMGVPLNQLYLVYPQTVADQIWSMTESLQCRGVSVTVGQVDKISRIEARRFQLAAERGGGVGILLRPMNSNAQTYSAATRWLVSPHPGTRTIQRWKIQLLHAHGGRAGQVVILEQHRDTRALIAIDPQQTESISAPSAAAPA